jgi:protein-tyrosine phosphatase
MSQIFDFHSHVLPGIDDGSKNVEMSLKMLRMLAKQGISHVVATPHFYPQYDTPERFLRRRAESEKILRDAMANESGLPTLSIGAEVYYFSGMSDSDAIRELTIDKNRCTLIEMPSMPWTEVMYRELEALYVKRGLIPVVAHVDRYLYRFSAHGILKRY